MRSAGRRVLLEATCHEMAEMTYIRLQRAGQQRKDKERQERKREREKEGAQPAKWDQCPHLDVARVNEASKTEMPTSAAKERKTKREREREIDRERERGAATLQKVGNLQLREQHVPHAALIARKPC